MKTLTTTINDKFTDGDGSKEVKLQVDAEHNSIYITAEGYEDGCGENPTVMMEIWDGELRVVIWSDINNQDPTHIISLEGAKSDKRIELDDNGNCKYCGQKCFNGQMCDEQQAGGFNQDKA